MSMPVVTIDASADLHDAYALYRTNAVRRLAVVRNGQFVGIVAIDDLIVHFAAELSNVARPVTAELLFSHHDVPVPAVVTAS
jgi:signal-transduction protein with cAMP-binding, CBS, and nucleotidyltransferase domain